MAAVQDDDLWILSEEELALASPAEREQYRRYLIFEAQKRDDWQILLPALMPHYASKPFAPHHYEFWDWVWDIKAGERQSPMVCIWPRGQAKSTSAEMAVAMMGARGERKYVLYVSEIQEQADDHVGNIAALFESEEMELAYPAVADRMVGKHGTTKGWRRDRIRTGSGFTVDAVGLDSAARGIKLEDMRPDLIVLDDIDSEHDGEAATLKKIKTITQKLLPAGDPNTCVVLAIQNKVHDDSIFARFIPGHEHEADFLRDRTLCGNAAIPAVWDLEYEDAGGRWVITGGTPSWPEGQGIPACEENMNQWGLTAFLAEAQHRGVTESGDMFNHLNWSALMVTEAQLPRLKRVVAWLDPAVTSTDRSDSQGIQIDGLGTDGKIYRLYSWEGRLPPLEATKKALRKAIEWKADTLGFETDQGGDTWITVYDRACEDLRKEEDTFGMPVLAGLAPRFKQRKASQGHGAKATRAQKMLVDYERHRFKHLQGTSIALELALTRFPKRKPFDLVDSAYWSWYELTNGSSGRGRVSTMANYSTVQFTPSGVN